MGVTFDHDSVFELLGAWALDACEDDEARAVEAHVAGCDVCAREAMKLREAAGWLGALDASAPPPALEASVMQTALARRPAPPVVPSTPPQLLAHQADALGSLLASLGPAEWNAATDAGWTSHELVGHLLASASYLTWHLGLLPEDPAHGETDWVPRSEVVINGERHHDPAHTAAQWRLQAELLLAHVAAADDTEMARTIPWFEGHAPLRILAIVHAFETWVHAEDIRRATGRAPQPPSAGDLACMSDLAVQLIAGALRDGGESGHEGRARVVLTGPGGGDWTIAIGHAAADGFVHGVADVTVTADVVEFCVMVGGRMRPDRLPSRIAGDEALAGDVLATAASFAFP